MVSLLSTRVIAGSVLGLLGIFVVIISSLGIVGNYEELGVHFCSNPQPYPVCSSILWLIVELALIAVVGIAMVVGGLYIASNPAKTVRSNPADPSILILRIPPENNCLRRMTLG